jgi:hypothetical protein
MRHVKFDLAASRLIILPHIDPARGRSEMTVAAETNVAEMVTLAFPGLPSSALDRVRVTLGEHIVAREAWRHVRPKPHATVIIRMVPGDDTLRSVLSIAVTVGAIALGQFYAPALLGGLTGGLTGYGGFALTGASALFASGIATVGFAMTGNLLINALIPARGLGDKGKDTDIYAITGLQNSSNPGGVIPSVLGKHRYAPVYAATPYTEIIGSDQYVIAAFLFGHGPLSLTNHRLGDTPISEYNDVQIEVRQGYTSDTPLTLYSQQVIEEQLSVRLTYQQPVIRQTARDATEVSIDITYVQGLIWYGDKGEKKTATVYFGIFQRKIGDVDWSTVATIGHSGAEQNIIRRNYRWALPERGQYEIKIVRATEDTNDSKIFNRSDWSAIRSFRPESPFNFDKPVAMVALRIRASNQLNGTVNNYNADASLICSDWDAASQAWVVRETSNPASLFRQVLQGRANAYPKTDDQIDLEKIQEWHEFCVSKGLTYNRVHDYDATRFDVLADIAAAGRATPNDDGTRLGVTIDRPQTTYVSAISPRNSWDFQGSTPQVLFPDGHRVQFIDETNGYNQAERIVPFPGVPADQVQVTEDLPMPGVTDPDQIWKAARRRQYELIHRPHTYSVSQDIESLVLSRGDLVPLNHDILDRDHIAARVRSIAGQTVVIDTPVTMHASRSYACVIRKADGTSVRRSVIAFTGETSNLTLIGDLAGVEAGDLVSVGTSIKGPVIDCVVKSIERGDNLTAKITLIDAAPVIDDLVDADVPPAWYGRIGGELDVSSLTPAVPIIGNITTGQDGTIYVPLSPGAGSVATPASYIVSHRLAGGGSYTTLSIAAGAGVAAISGYDKKDTVDIKAHAVTDHGQASADTAVSNRYGFLAFTSGYSDVNAGTIYLGSSTANATEASVQLTLTGSGTISHLSATPVIAPGGSQTFSYTLRKNGSDTALTCTVTGDVVSANDDAHSVSVATGDKVDIKLVVSGSAAKTTHNVAVRITSP